MIESVLDQAFPLHVIVDVEGTVLRASSQAWRILRVEPGECAADVLVVEEPTDARPGDWGGLVGRLVALRSRRGSGVSVRTQVLALDGRHFALVGTPRVRTVEEMDTLGLTFSDFAPHDATFDLLAMTEAQRETIEDLHKAMRDLKRATRSIAVKNKALSEALDARHEAEAKLVEASKMEALGRLVGGVTHDYNNLLVAILGYAEVGADETNEPASRAAFQAIRRAGQRAAALTGRLLAFARRGHGGSEVSDLAEVVDGLRDLLERLLDRRVRLFVQVSSTGLPVPLDASAIEQIVVNLAINAGDAMPDGGSLRITTRGVRLDRSAGGVPPGEWVVLRVKDSGQGIPDDVMAHIFEPFFTTKELGKGTGLGLATVFGLVDSAGGQVRVSSEPGQGTLFEVWLPRAVGAATTLPSREPRTAPPRSATILLVDDEDSVRRIVARMLVRSGYQVVPVANGEEALEAFDNGIDVVVTDVSMPGCSGPELARRLWATRPGLPVVLMTGYDTGEAIAEAVDRGARLLPKPFDRDRLLRTVDTSLAGTEPPTLPSVWRMVGS